MKKVNVGVIGCGMVSRRYIDTMKQFEILDIKSCSDLDLERAKTRAEEFQIPKACSPSEVLNDKEIQLVVDLTIPAARHELAMAAIQAGKSLYSEKPLAVTRKHAREILDAARAKGVTVGSAPDAFMGDGLQACRRIIDAGTIGRPLGAVAFMLMCGPEISYHANPEFFYQPGGGPLFDTGPYYVSGLVHLLGPVGKICAMAKASYPVRTIGNGPKTGKQFPVETPTYISGTMEFANGTTATLIASFETWAHSLPSLEIYGSEGTLRLGVGANTFKGPVLVRKRGQKEWEEIPFTERYSQTLRGLGIAEMADAMVNGRTPRASGEFAYHTLDIMQGFLDSAADSRFFEVQSSCKRPEPLVDDAAWGDFNLARTKSPTAVGS